MHGVSTYPNSRSLASIQHMKLHSGLVNNAPGNTVERIDLAEDGSLADASEAGVTGASAEIFNLWGNERRASSSSRCCCTRFRAGMAASYDNHIKGPVKPLSLATSARPTPAGWVAAHLAPSETVAKCLWRFIVDIMRLPRALCRRIAYMTFVVAVKEIPDGRNSCRATFRWSKLVGDWRTGVALYSVYHRTSTRRSEYF